MMGMWLLMLVFWGGLILVAIWLVRGLFNPQAASSSGHEGLDDILQQRYARGEISRAEYEQMQHDLDL